MKTSKSVVEDIYPLSPMQQGMLFHTLYDSQVNSYFEQMQYAMQGDFDESSFKRAWQGCIKRHSILRTHFAWDDLEKPLQVVRDRVELPWIVCDWRDLPEQQQQERVQDFLEKDRRRGFRLTQAPLFRVALIRMTQTNTLFVWSFHHALFDGWSVALLLQELFACYEAYRRNEPYEVPSRRPYRDYISWLQEQDQGKAEHFWQSTLAGFITPTTLEMDQGTGKKHEPSLEQVQDHITFPREATARLQAFAQQHKLTLNTLLQGVWALLLSRYSGAEDVVFGAVVSGRPEKLRGSESMIGLFINTLPVRVVASPQQRLLPWLSALQAQQLEAREFEYSSLIDIQAWSEIPGTRPLFEHILVFENYPADSETFQQSLSLKIETLTANERTNYPLTLAVVPEQALELHLIYDKKRFQSRAIHSMLLQMQHLLQEIVTQPMQLLGELSLLTTVEYRQIISDWNDTTIPLAEQETVPDLFEAQVVRTPDAIALTYKDVQMTYGELNSRANLLAHELQTNGVGPETLVGLSCHRSAELIIAVLAILKAGGAYVPLDPTYPLERLDLIINDTQLWLIVTQENFSEVLNHHNCKLLYVEAFLRKAQEKEAQNPQRKLDIENIAYVIYTSGSTGAPKGVMMRHEGIYNIVRTQVKMLRMGSDSRIAQIASLNFDASVWEIISPLTIGGSLYIDTREAMMPGPALLELLDQQATTIAAFTPSVLAALPDAELPTLRTLVVAGEVCAEELMARWSEGRHFHNAYGPTETTIYSTIALDIATTAPPTIGRPIANTQVYILDTNLQPVPPGVSGEMYIGGSGLARGYLNQPGLTAERFVPDPLSTQPGKRLYKTGDMARYTFDGQIEFIGRNDHQLKIRGLRIEPGEIEMALSLHSAVQRCIVVGRKGGNGEHHLVAYVLPTTGEQPFPQDLRHFLEGKLPSHMVPDTFIIINELPLAPNGKVDLFKLPSVDEIQSTSTSQIQLPQDLLELQLLQAYEEILQIYPINTTDDFFVLGGHSLTAVRLVSEIQKRLSITITLPMLFRTGTVAQLAQHLRQQQDTTAVRLAHSPLVALQRKGKYRPLFCVHPANGHIIAYYGLLPYLSPDQPVYGLQDMDAYENEITARSVEDMAREYLAAI